MIETKGQTEAGWHRPTGRRFLDVVVDMLTILALTIAGIGHLGPWFSVRPETYRRSSQEQEVQDEVRSVQADLVRVETWHAHG